MRNKSEIFVYTFILLCVAQVLVILFSWIASVLMPELGLNSLLNGSGIRWLLSTYSDNLSSGWFICFLLASMSLGTFFWSGLPQKIISFNKCTYNEKFGTLVFFFGNIVALIVCAVLAFWPDSPLLNVSGELFPGPYLKAVLLILGSSIFVGSVSFALLCNKLERYEDSEQILIYGIQKVVPLVVIYFLLKELVAMMQFVIEK